MPEIKRPTLTWSLSRRHASLTRYRSCTCLIFDPMSP